MSFKVQAPGDLFASDAEALAHGVNCHGVMGGLAGLIEFHYPDAAKVYKQFCKDNSPWPGQALLTPSRHGKQILHLFSQNHPGPDAREDWLLASLRAGYNLLSDHYIGTLALPLIGGGIGGLDPDLCEDTIHTVADEYPSVDTTLVLPNAR